MSQTERLISLVDAPRGRPLRLVSISGGQVVRRRLFSLGLHIGDIILVRSRGILRGPVLVRNLASDTSLALGRGVAQKILVEPVRGS